jgi:hypothetical protein
VLVIRRGSAARRLAVRGLSSELLFEEIDIPNIDYWDACSRGN